MKSQETEKLIDMKTLTHQVPEIEKKGKKKGRVHFDLDEMSKPKIYEHPPLVQEMTQDLIEALWWTVEDMVQFKQTVFDIAGDLRTSPKVRRLLRNVMKAATEFADHSFWNKEVRQREGSFDANDVCAEESVELNEETGSNAFLEIVDWCRYHEERRGLEKWSCFHYFEARERLYFNGVEDVLKQQMKHRLYDTSDLSSADRDRRTTAIRNVALRTSKPAHILALAMGAADAAALIEIQKEESIEEMVEVTCFSRIFNFHLRKKFDKV